MDKITVSRRLQKFTLSCIDRKTGVACKQILETVDLRAAVIAVGNKGLLVTKVLSTEDVIRVETVDVTSNDYFSRKTYSTCSFDEKIGIQIRDSYVCSSIPGHITIREIVDKQRHRVEFLYDQGLQEFRRIPTHDLTSYGNTLRLKPQRLHTHICLLVSSCLLYDISRIVFPFTYKDIGIRERIDDDDDDDDDDAYEAWRKEKEDLEKSPLFHPNDENIIDKIFSAVDSLINRMQWEAEYKKYKFPTVKVKPENIIHEYSEFEKQSTFRTTPFLFGRSLLTISFSTDGSESVCVKPPCEIHLDFCSEESDGSNIPSDFRFMADGVIIMPNEGCLHTRDLLKIVEADKVLVRVNSEEFAMSESEKKMFYHMLSMMGN